MNEVIMNAINPHRVDAIRTGRCPICENPVSGDEFRDGLSRKEFEISGLCQKCQDSIWPQHAEQV